MSNSITALPLLELWEKILSTLNEQPERLADFKTIYQINLTGEESGSFLLSLKDQQAQLLENEAVADVTLTMSVNDFKKLLTGKLNSTAAYMMGKLKVKGNIGYALKLESLLKKYDLN
ncbi:SCP2 sterol-binding domain-containing protein [Bacillus kwashiorkori]|uniref:SCP2 sterol-binding domain-containing protein n=1 Tax=Bacillus kwashiorkori TaxID=1522318 RepID=UPI0007838C9E|nr:SCP2 sterol-binding domain-containing protein [Bacillus kwashiorkori]